VIDARTQPGFVAGGPVVELDGSVAGAGVNGIHVDASNSAIRGLVVHSYGDDGSRSRTGASITVAGTSWART